MYLKSVCQRGQWRGWSGTWSFASLTSLCTQDWLPWTYVHTGNRLVVIGAFTLRPLLHHTVGPTHNGGCVHVMGASLTAGVENPCIMSPLVSAMILNDAARLSFLVTRCVGSLNVSAPGCMMVCLSEAWLPACLSDCILGWLAD